ncbi:glycosyltransferase domain-containing protein [Acerihabitans sp. TG2]|uniref:glycosyltransferase domain-containing protein n=1 Tax=Acerihabitans sp. TG2 TaxID=3096008 RepID=UPI002B234400|nr:glycosyltransferase domain-containing protein [Acerihabitans sp. TG2]MEA9389285.1 glycosyltransferase domain-containing protein [Acerihabitans sp. TG2]
MKKIVIYTALFGDYDNLHEPKDKYNNCDFVCFTDNRSLASKNWRFIYIDVDFKQNNTLLNRHYKLFPHKYFLDYTFSIYIDSNIKILNNPYSLINKYLNDANIALPKHLERCCLYREADICVEYGIAKSSDVEVLINRYHKEGFPENFGLAENNIILRRHNSEEILRLMEAWWKELNNGPKRDQLSLMYLMWKYKISFELMDENSKNKNKYFTYMLHKKDLQKKTIKKFEIFINANFRKKYIYLSIKKMLDIIFSIKNFIKK